MPDIRWRLFAESLTQEKKLDAKALQNLGLPYVVPVAVLFYLRNVSYIRTCVWLTAGTKVHFCKSDAVTAEFIKIQ